MSSSIPSPDPIGRLRRLALELSGARPEELSLALALFAYNFLVITSYLIVKPVRNSLFLDHLGAENLPFAYIGTALFVGVAVMAYNRLVDRLSRTRVVVITWCTLAAGLLGFWFALSRAGVVASAFFYFFSAVYSVTGVTQFWSFAADVLDTGQARRLYGFLGAGGIAGGLAGGALTGALASTIGTEQLLFVSAALCLTCAGIGGYLSERLGDREPRPAAATPEAGPAPRVEASGKSAPALILEDRYLLLIVGLIFSLQMVSTLVDFQFSHVVAEALPDKDQKTAFFGTFFVCLNITSLFVQLVVTRWIHRHMGVGPALLVLPAVTLFTASGFLAAPVFLMGCALKLANGSLDYSIERASRELLYLPTSVEVKYKAKAFIDMFCFRLFRCLAGLVILAFGAVKGLPLQALSAVTLGVAVFWLATATAARREYVRQVRRSLGAPAEAAAPELEEEERDAILVEMGYEASRYVHALRVLDRRGPEWSATWEGLRARGRERLLGLCARLNGEEDLALVRAGLEDPARRALALELLESIGDPRVGRLVARILDDERDLEERLATGEMLLERIGDLPRRAQPRLVWTAPVSY